MSTTQSSGESEAAIRSQEQQADQEFGDQSSHPQEVDLRPRPQDPFVSLTSPIAPRRSWSPMRASGMGRGITPVAVTGRSRSLESIDLLEEEDAQLDDEEIPLPPLDGFRKTPIRAVRKQWQDKDSKSTTPPAFKKYAGSGRKSQTMPADQRQSDLDKKSKNPPPRKTSPGLPVNFLALNVEDQTDVDTYNNRLQEIAMGSDQDKAQRALNVLATMSRHGVGPNDATWGLVELCSDIGQADDTAKQLPGEPSLNSQLEKLSLYTEGGGLAGTIGSGSGHLQQHEDRRPKAAWRMEQDLSQLPPAFRSSILAMLRIKQKKESPNDDLKSVNAARQQDSSTSNGQSPASDPETKLDTFDKAVDDTKFPFKRASVARVDRPGEREVMTEGSAFSKPAQTSRTASQTITAPDVENSEIHRDAAPTTRPESILQAPGKLRIPDRWAPPKAKQEVPVTNEESERTHMDNKDNPNYELYLKHGVQRYMRPDGHGDAAQRKPWKVKAEKSPDTATPEAPLDLQTNNDLLLCIAESDLPDKAKRAGNVLKNMKENSVQPDDVTRVLLEKCSGVVPVQGIIKSLPNPPPDEMEYITPTGVVRKRVTFSDTIQTRIIRRRRSISATERWDDPLTPPKRVSGMVDLAPGRFSSELRDNRPSLPRRSDSMSSLLSGGSDHSILSDRSDRTGTSSSEDASIPDSPQPLDVPAFKLPFADSPQATAKGKQPQDERNLYNSQSRPGFEKSPRADDIADKPPCNRPRVRRRLSISGTTERRDAPLTPPRRVSAPLDFLAAGLKPSATNSIRGREGASNLDAIPRPATRRNVVDKLVKATHAAAESLDRKKGQQHKRPPLPGKAPVAESKVSARTHAARHANDREPPRKRQVEYIILSDSSDAGVSRLRKPATTKEEAPAEPKENLVERHQHLVSENWSVLDLPQKRRLKDMKTSELSVEHAAQVPNRIAQRRASSDTSYSAGLADGRLEGPDGDQTATPISRRASAGMIQSSPSDDYSLPSFSPVKLRENVASIAIKRAVAQGKQIKK